jgi:hypothetical protein
MADAEKGVPFVEKETLTGAGIIPPGRGVSLPSGPGISEVVSIGNLNEVLFGPSAVSGQINVLPAQR